MRACHRCKKSFDEAGHPGFNNTCSQCGMPLHACANCIHFVARGAVRCMVPAAQLVQDPVAGNRCSYFEFVNLDHVPEPSREAAFEAGAHMDAATARRKWNQLFGG